MGSSNGRELYVATTKSCFGGDRAAEACSTRGRPRPSCCGVLAAAAAGLGRRWGSEQTFYCPVSGGEMLVSSMVAKLKLKGIDGRAPPGVEPAAGRGALPNLKPCMYLCGQTPRGLERESARGFLAKK